MNHRTLGNSGLSISEVGLGCWQLGADWGDSPSEEKAFAILQSSVDQGVNFFDTADVYGAGLSERYIGNFLKQTGASVTVATKFGRNGEVFPDKYSESALRKSIQSSCQRLQVDRLDLLQLHCIPTEELRKGHVFDWLRKAKSDGLIQNFGASVESVEEGLICLDQEGLTSLQVIFNIFRQKLVNELFPQAQHQGVGIIVRLPLASGLLTGKFSRNTTFPENDHRNYNRDGAAFNVGETFAGLPFEKGLELAKQIEKDYLPKGLSMVQLALRWILDHEAVTTIIPGASSPEQARSNAEVTEILNLSSAVHKALQTFYHERVKEYIRGPY